MKLSHSPKLQLAFAPKGLRLEAQGCRLGYPGSWNEEVSTATRLCQCPEDYRRSKPLCGFVVAIAFVPRV